MSLRTTPRRRTAARAGVVGLVALTSLGLAVPAALAAPAARAPAPVVVPLEHTGLEFALTFPQTTGTVPVASPQPDLPYSGPLPVGYGGTVTVTVPPQLAITGTTPAVRLALAPEDAGGPGDQTRTYSTDPDTPADLLAVTDLGGGRLQIAVPADDGVNGPRATLYVDVDSAVPGAEFVPPAHVQLRLSAGGPSTVDVDTQVVATSCANGCPHTGAVPAGASVAVTVPDGSPVAALGVPDLRTSAFSLQPADGSGAAVPVTPTLSADARTATVAVPADAAPGRYALGVVAADAAQEVVVRTKVTLDVTAAQETVAQNPGLRSDTGWVEPATGADGGVSPLVFLGGGMLVAAGLTTAVVLRPRRRAAAE